MFKEIFSVWKFWNCTAIKNVKIKNDIMYCIGDSFENLKTETFEDFFSDLGIFDKFWL